MLEVELRRNPSGGVIGERGVVDPIVIRLEQLRIGRRGGQVESELALIGRAISDLQHERQLIGGEQAARMFGRVLEPCTGDRIGEGGRVGAGAFAGVGEAEVGHRLQYLAVEIGGVGGDRPAGQDLADRARSEEHTSELQSLMSISYAVLCLKNKYNSTILRHD